MNFKFIPDIKNLVVIEPDLYKDNRGENFEGYDTDKFLDIVKSSNSLSNKFKDKKFVLDTFSKCVQRSSW